MNLLRFRHSPLSFPLPRSCHLHIIQSRAETTVEYFFGYAVLFTKNKKRGYRNLNTRPATFSLFVRRFIAFISSARNSEVIYSSRYFGKRTRSGQFVKRGLYSADGTYMSELYEGGVYVKIDNPERTGDQLGDVNRPLIGNNFETTVAELDGQDSDVQSLDLNLVQDSGGEDEVVENSTHSSPAEQGSSTRRTSTQSTSTPDSSTRRASTQSTSGRNATNQSSSASTRSNNNHAAQRRESGQQRHSSTTATNRAATNSNTFNASATHSNRRASTSNTTTNRRGDNSGRRATTAGEQSAFTSGNTENFRNDDANSETVPTTPISPNPSVLSNTSLRYLIGRWNLANIQRTSSAREIHVPVARNDYTEVRNKIIRGNSGGYVITGPTGCGKSTVALLPLFDNPSHKTLIVEPTQANAANILHEFKNILPNMVRTNVIQGRVPLVSFAALTITSVYRTPLTVTTTEKLLEFIYFKGELPKFDYIIVDEFHLPIPSMVEVVEFFRTFILTSKYIFVSATAQGYSVSPQLPRGVTKITGNLPLGRIPKPLERSDLDPRRWFKTGDGTVAIVTPSVSIAKQLTRVYRSWNLRAFLITRDTVVSDYMRAATDYRPHTVFVLEPGVEAGVTLSISVLISMGTTSAIRYDGRTVVEDDQPLDEIAAIQRGGRGGRVKPTLYIVPREHGGTNAASTADYFRAQAIIKCVAMGANILNMSIQDILLKFPKLNSLTKEYAATAVRTGGDPFIAVYKTSPSGEIYTECGGTGEGFNQLAAKELFVYTYPDGFYVAPISDFTDLNSQPDTFVIRTHQFAAARAIVAAVAGLEGRYTLDNLTELLIQKFAMYIDDFFKLMKTIFSGDTPQPFVLDGVRVPEVADFISASPPLVRLFDYLKTQPLGIIYERKIGTGRQVSSTHSFKKGDHVLHFAFDSRYMRDNHLEVATLSDDVLNVFRGLLAIEILLDGAKDKCVDLTQYKERVPIEHKWYKRKVLRS
ncbi:putative movement protein [Erysiphe necator associated tobamo-like virus 1]|nr:putative movement protein [Erysiphe necator associated tobamo-like virus 1]